MWMKNLLSVFNYFRNKISTIKNQLIISFILLIIIPTAIISFIFYSKSTSSLTKKTENIIEMNFHLLEANILKEINLIDKVVTQIYLDNEMLDSLSYSQPMRYFYLFSKYNLTNDTTSFIQSSKFENILNTYTSTLDYTYPSNAKLYVHNYKFGAYKFPSNVFDLQVAQSTPWFVDIPADSNPHIMYIPGSNNKNLPQGVNYVRRLFGLKNYNIPFSSLITVELSMEEINTMLVNLKPTLSSQLFLINEDGMIIASTEKGVVFTPFTDTRIPFSPKAYEDYGFTTNVMNYKKAKTLLSSKTMPETNWTIISMTPFHEISSDINKIQKFIKFVVFIVILISLLIALFLAYRITNPIKKLVTSMSSLDADNLHVEIEDHHFNDEFRYLIDHYNATNKKIRGLIKTITKIEKEKKEAEFKALQAQINPHFLYNTLDAVNWLALKYDAEDISIMVTSLSDFFRYSLSKGKTIISLKNEFIQTESYLAIQKIRYPDMIDYSISYDEHILDCSIVKLTLQPLVENAILHGIEPNGEPGLIEIRGTREDDRIIVKVIDNGIGADVESLNHILADPSNDDHSYGIKNVNQRIKNYFGEAYGITFLENDLAGITVQITIPFMAHEEMKNKC